MGELEPRLYEVFELHATMQVLLLLEIVQGVYTSLLRVALFMKLHCQVYAIWLNYFSLKNISD